MHRDIGTPKRLQTESPDYWRFSNLVNEYIDRGAFPDGGVPKSPDLRHRLFSCSPAPAFSGLRRRVTH
jgi:hypothetical protein